jgi:hypothetical protein
VSSKPVVTFYYDVISPWSLFAYRLLQRYEKPWNLDVQLRPRYLGGVMQGSGNKVSLPLPPSLTSPTLILSPNVASGARNQQGNLHEGVRHAHGI